MTTEECKEGLAVEVRFSGDKWVTGVIAFQAGWGKAGKMFAVELCGGKLEFAYPSEMRQGNVLDRFAREV